MQYEYLNRNVTAAIEMMENKTVDVYINECFDTSLRFMAHEYQMASSATVEEFLQNSSAMQANQNEAAYAKLLTTEQLSKIRAKAKVWFANDYQFYNVAVRHLRRRLAALSLPYECPVVLY